MDSLFVDSLRLVAELIPDEIDEMNSYLLKAQTSIRRERLGTHKARLHCDQRIHHEVIRHYPL